MGNRVMPERSWAEWIKSEELSRWKVPRELEGKVKELEGKVLDSFEELRDKFPSNKYFGEVYLREHLKKGNNGFDRYSRPYQVSKYLTVDVAYGCPRCNKIIIGPPEIEIEKWDNDDYGLKLPFKRHPLETEERLLYICKNCKAIIDLMEYGKID